MKTLLRITVATLAMLLSVTVAPAQSLIYGVDHGQLVTLDYLTGAYDTVVQPTNFPSPNTSFGVTIDPFSGRYFWDIYPYGESGTVKSIDLTSLQVQALPWFENKNLIEYNCLNNSLIFEAVDGDFYSCDLATNTVTLLSTLPPASGIIYGETRVFNPLKNHYFSERSANGQVQFDIIDGFTGAMINTHPAPSGMIESPVVDFQTGNYYGVHNDSVVLFDPLTDLIQPLVKLPFPMNHLDNQMAVYDQENAKYVLPIYRSSNSKAYYVVVDIPTATIDTFYVQPSPWMEWQRIYSKPTTLVARVGDSLVCPHGISYQWLRNGDAIPNANGPSYTPVLSGNYSVSVEYANYASTSKEVEFIMSGTPEDRTSRDPAFSVYPNPASSQVVVTLNGPVKGRAHLTVFDPQGRPVMQTDLAPGSTTVGLESLPAGIYLFRVTDGGTVFSRKVVVE